MSAPLTVDISTSKALVVCSDKKKQTSLGSFRPLGGANGVIEIILGFAGAYGGSHLAFVLAGVDKTHDVAFKEMREARFKHKKGHELCNLMFDRGAIQHAPDGTYFTGPSLEKAFHKDKDKAKLEAYLAKFNQKTQELRSSRLHSMLPFVKYLKLPSDAEMQEVESALQAPNLRSLDLQDCAQLDPQRTSELEQAHPKVKFHMPDHILRFQKAQVEKGSYQLPLFAAAPGTSDVTLSEFAWCLEHAEYFVIEKMRMVRKKTMEELRQLFSQPGDITKHEAYLIGIIEFEVDASERIDAYNAGRSTNHGQIAERCKRYIKTDKAPGEQIDEEALPYFPVKKSITPEGWEFLKSLVLNNSVKLLTGPKIEEGKVSPQKFS